MGEIITCMNFKMKETFANLFYEMRVDVWHPASRARNGHRNSHRNSNFDETVMKEFFLLPKLKI